MKLTIERAALLTALGHVQSVVERRNTIPILSNVLISADRGQVAFSATDLDMEIADWAQAHVETPGEITAPAHTLYEIVRKLPEGAEVALAYTGDDPRLQVEAGRARFSLPVLPAADFPLMSSDGLCEPIAIDTSELVRLIDKTRFAMSTEETRYYLNGLYLHAALDEGERRLRAVATDGRRLALAEVAAPEGFANLPGVIIPRKTVGEVRRLLDDAGETVTLAISPQKVRFSFEQASLTSKVIDGAFPAYEQVMPRANARSLTLGKAPFAAAVDRVATIAADQTRAVRFQVGEGRMTLWVRNMDASQAVEEVDVDHQGEPIDVSFNARYLLDVASQVGDAIEFRFPDALGAGSQDPTLVLDPADAGVQYVLAPLRA
jgi:DNA polymerase-3 subunit beta